MIFYPLECEEKIGYTYKDKFLLRRAFTHTSYANEQNEVSYENLEFLGDSILNFVVGDYLFKKINGDEGDLTVKRASLVSAKPIANVIISLGLHEYILLGVGEQNKAVNVNICSDVFEAVVASIYLDGGIEPAKKFIYDKLILPNSSSPKPQSDFKSKLQDYVQQKKLGVIKYKLLSKKGPDHAPEFTCGVELNGQLIAEGIGSNKKSAEQIAAKLGIKKIKSFKQRGKRN